MKDYAFAWIRFEQLSTPAAKLTLVWRVIAKKDGVILGYVQWDTGWRRYVFFPNDCTIYEQDCLRDLATFVEDRTREHKAARAEAKRTA